MEIIGILESDEIIDHLSIFTKIVYSMNGGYLPFDDFVGKKVRIVIEEV
jgi:hypothetical protein